MKTKSLQFKSSLAYKGRIIWLFAKYQLLTKGVLTLLVYPIYSFIISLLLNQSGRTVFSSGDFMSFLLSFNGVSLLIVTLIFMMILFGLDINSFIIMSALIKEGKIEMTARHMIAIGIKSLRYFFSPIGLLVMVYAALIFPLIGVGVTISPMKNFQIPNFITSVIYASPLYFALYNLVLLLLAYISYRFAFVFHYILISGYGSFSALIGSWKLTKKFQWEFLKDLVLAFLKRLTWLYFPLTIIVSSLIFLLIQLSDGTEPSRFLLFFILLGISELLTLITFIFMPIFVLSITDLFYKYNHLEGQTIELQLTTNATSWLDNVKHKIRLKTKLWILLGIFVAVVVNLIVSAILTVFFDPIFKTHHPIEIVAHRAGGDLGAENTVEGIIEAAKEGASWTEIDIQRTKDGRYILNHDSNFRRVAGDSRTSSEMTLKEVEKLEVRNLFDPSKPSQPVPTIEEVIKASKGKIGLFIELKGKTADKKMVDDMVKLIKKEKLGEQAVLLSLDYTLIEYIEKKYPEIQSGYLYYFAIGQTNHLLGDYLIMEEREATSDNIDLLKSSGKKVIVWTVNTPESIGSFVNSKVDGIITDYVLAVKEGIKTRDKRTDLEMILDKLFE